jgi:hypothetical protein
MAFAHSPKIVTDGMVFYYDTGNSKSYKGEPTVNTADTTGIATYWDNSGTAAWSSDDTAVPRLFSDLPVFSMEKLTDGNSHIGIGSTAATVSTEYTYSVYVWIPSSNSPNMAGAQPYFRPQPANYGAGILTYEGSVTWGTWPRDQWIRVSVTATTQSTNVTSAYISCYLDTAGDKIYFTAPQFEQKGHLTPFVNGTRSATEGLFDFTKNATIDLTNVSFDSDAQMTFDGTDDWINLGQVNSLLGNTVVSAEFIVDMSTALDSNDRKIFHYSKAGTTDGVFQVRKGGNNSQLMYQYNNAGTWYSLYLPNAITAADTFNHFVFTHSGNEVKAYKNGEFILNGIFAVGLDWTDADELYIGYRAASEYWKGDIPIMKFYNRALTAEEVQQNYNTIKGRFGI